MAARGARSRKVLDKTIEKQVHKKEAKNNTNSFSRVDSPGWDISSNSWSEESSKSNGKGKVRSGSQLQQVSNGFTGSRPTSAGGLSSLSGNSKDKDKPRYNTKGKETSHPRGRGGGVPGKNNAPPVERPLNRTASNRASVEVRPVVNKKWCNMMTWSGNGHRPQPYRGFQHDTDMWMETGDCHIYFTAETDEMDPRPSLRLHVSELERAHSTLLSNMIRYSVVEKDDDDLGIFPVPSSSTSRLPPSRPLTRKNQGRDAEDSPLPRRDSLEHMARPLNTSRGGFPDSSRAPGSRRIHTIMDDPTYHSASDQASLAGYSNDEVEITHEIWFPAPAHAKTHQAQLRHHIAQRNFFALLYNRPIVGTDFLEMLLELQAVIDTFYELDGKAHTQWSAQMIARYMLTRKMDDVRGNLRMALGLLAWCEQDNVRWMAGYLEAFVHCVGMMTPNVAESAEFRRLSTVTRMNLNNAANVLQLRVLEAEEKLASFNPSDLWPNPPSKGSAGTAHQKSYAAFQEFLKAYYSRTYRSWPPSQNNQGTWLTRERVRRLQHDFGALYDYLVDRSICWSEQEASASRKWQMVSKKPFMEPVSVDSLALPLTDIFIGFDNRHGYAHIPHPYPLLPQGNTTSSSGVSVKKSIFGKLQKSKAPSTRDTKEQLQVALAFNDATNLDKLGVAFEASDLIDHFERYEKEVELKGITPREARLGRWVLLYGILQILSTLSVDTRGLKYSDGIDYFLCPSLKKCPPWDPNARRPMSEAAQEDSYCWAAPARWEAVAQPQTGGGGDATGRGSSLAELGSDGRLDNSAFNELDGRAITRSQLQASQRLERDMGAVDLEDKYRGIKSRVDRPHVPDRSPLRELVLPEKERELGSRYSGAAERSYFEDDGIRFV